MDFDRWNRSEEDEYCRKGVATVFWDYQGVVYLDYEKMDKTATQLDIAELMTNQLLKPTLLSRSKSSNEVSSRNFAQIIIHSSAIISE